MLRSYVEKSYLIVPVIGVLAIIGWHYYYGNLHPLDFEEQVYYGNKTYFEKIETAEKLVSLSPEELEDIRLQGEKGMGEVLSSQERTLFPTAAEVADEMTVRYGQPDSEALASFIVGISHLAAHEPHHALRLFRRSMEKQETRSVHLAIGYTLKKLGEDLASYDVYAALKEESQTIGDDTLLKRAYHLADPTTGRHNLMMGVGIIVGGVLSILMALVMIGVWIRSLRRARMGIKPNEWPSMRRAIYLKRMRDANDRDTLDVLEREIGQLLDRRVDGFGGENRPPALATIREEAEKTGVDPPSELHGEREYLSAIFLDAIGAHDQAQRNYANALRKADLPSIHLAHGISLSYLNKRGAARKAYAQAVERGREIDENLATVARAKAYLAGH